jgi:hypothetical protein
VTNNGNLLVELDLAGWKSVGQTKPPRLNTLDSTSQVSKAELATMSSGSSTLAKFFEQFKRPQKQRSLSQPELPEAVTLHSNANKPSLERRKTIDGGIQPLRGENRNEDRYLSGVLAAGSGI